MKYWPKKIEAGAAWIACAAVSTNGINELQHLSIQIKLGIPIDKNVRNP
jgi:hypothetical protein